MVYIAALDDPEFGLGEFPEEVEDYFFPGSEMPPAELFEEVSEALSLSPGPDPCVARLPEHESDSASSGDATLLLPCAEPVAAPGAVKRRRLNMKQAVASIPRVAELDSDGVRRNGCERSNVMSLSPDVWAFSPKIWWENVVLKWPHIGSREKYRLIHRRFFNWLEVVHTHSRRLPVAAFEDLSLIHI